MVLAVALFVTVACSARSQKAVVTHDGKGVVVAVDVDKARVKINHDKIEGYMDAMTMWFPVKDATMLIGIAQDDKVEFTVSGEPSADVITALRKIP